MKIRTRWLNGLLFLILLLPGVGQPSLATLPETAEAPAPRARLTQPLKRAPVAAPKKPAEGPVLSAAEGPVLSAAEGPVLSETEGPVLSETEGTREQQARQTYANLPLTFIENQGQRDARVAYYAQQGGANIYFTAEEVVMALPESVLRLRFVDANPDVRITGHHSQAATVSYFVGNDPEQWHNDIPTYGEMTYYELYPGVDLTYTGRGEALKYAFILQPGADVDAIRLAYAGADQVRLAENGDLLVTPEGAECSMRDAAPYAYQEIDGARVAVDAAFTLYDDHTYGFALGAYDPGVPLVIDPTLLYSTLLGGSSTEYGHAITLDDDGNAYVTGETVSTDFPTITGAYTTTYQGGNGDVFVSVLSADLSTLRYSTFLGGESTDVGHAIALDDAGNIYLTGETSSGDFPTTSGAYTTTHQTRADVFLSVLSPDLSTLSYSTYLGGFWNEYGRGVAVDTIGHAYITGYTHSEDFPTTMGAYTTTHQGGQFNYDAFVSVLDPAGNGESSLLYSTFLGGYNASDTTDKSYAIALDDDNNVYVTGETLAEDFPTTSGAYTTTHSGDSDVFVSVLDPEGNGTNDLLYSTFLGGSEADICHDLALDGDGNVYLAGVTTSSDFPATPGAYDTSLNEDYNKQDTFVAAFDPTLSTLSSATFLGGSGLESAQDTAIALLDVDGTGQVYVTADTGSDDFPTTADAYTTIHQGDVDVFVSVFSADLSGLSYATFLGGASGDYGESIALDNDGNAYVTGFTYTSDPADPGFPTTPGAYTTTYQGGADVFVAKLGPAADLVIDKTVLPATPVYPGDTVTYTLAFSNRGVLTATHVVITDHVPVSVSVQRVISSGIAITAAGAGRPYVWEVADLAQNDGGVIILTGVLSDPLTMGIFTNTAVIDTITPESDETNNRDETGVTVPNVAPTADDDDYSTTEDTPLHVPAPGVLDGDNDANGDTLTATLDTNVMTGTLALAPDGGFIYTPTLNDNGSVTFTYHVRDAISNSNTALVTVTISDLYDIYLPLVLRY